MRPLFSDIIILRKGWHFNQCAREFPIGKRERLLLSLMTITRERQSHPSGRQTDRRRDSCPCKRSHPGLRHLHRKHAGSGGITRKRLKKQPPFSVMIILWKRRFSGLNSASFLPCADNSMPHPRTFIRSVMMSFLNILSRLSFKRRRGVNLSAGTSL